MGNKSADFDFLESKHRIGRDFKLKAYKDGVEKLVLAIKKQLSRDFNLHEEFDLSEVHKLISRDRLASGLKENGWVVPLSSFGDEVINSYHGLLLELYKSDGEDFVFEVDPTLRFHLPGPMGNRFRLNDGRVVNLHSDMLFGDYFEQINCWLPLCDVHGTAALWLTDMKHSVEALESFAESTGHSIDDFINGRDGFFNLLKTDTGLLERVLQHTYPVEMKTGQCLFFDPRVLHGAQENSEDSTRVSIDFRIIYLNDYEHIQAELERSGKAPREYDGLTLTKGGYYAPLSVAEISREKSAAA